MTMYQKGKLKGEWNEKLSEVAKVILWMEKIKALCGERKVFQQVPFLLFPLPKFMVFPNASVAL